MMPLDLELDLASPTAPQVQSLARGAMILRGFALRAAPALITAVADIDGRAPFRRMVTPGGWPMSVAMTNCGHVGWVSDRRGYRYDQFDPESERAWPAMPSMFADLATAAAAASGYPAFDPDACLINRYEPGTRLTLHQDLNEHDTSQPIVSVSLGLPAIFLWGGQRRADRPRRVPLLHGDVAVWGGPSRMTFHGVDSLKDGDHPLTGAIRLNLTFRKAR